MQQLRDEIEVSDALAKKKIRDEVNPGFGYGGKFGVEKDR
jgi:cortactin